MDSNRQMYCQHCGAINYKTNYRCISCSQVLVHNHDQTDDSGEDEFVDPFGKDLEQPAQEQAPTTEAEPKIPFQSGNSAKSDQRQARKDPYATTYPGNFLVQSILVTIFCCLPFGIVAIVFSAQVDTYWSARQYKAAHDAADNARKWGNIGLITGIVVGVLYFILVVASSL